uniref:Uncharacterized protein n=1 Tax=Salvator merianae TaxID=96440 RepID=A0A8D0B3H4_SALMN
MPKVKHPKGSGGGAGAPINVPLAEQIIQDASVKPVSRVKRRGKASKHGGREEDEYVDEKLSRRILEQARIQQEELETEHDLAGGQEPKVKKKTTVLGEDEDSGSDDDEWPSLEKAAVMEKGDYCEDVTVNPEDEKAIEMFMNKNPPLRCCLNTEVENCPKPLKSSQHCLTGNRSFTSQSQKHGRQLPCTRQQGTTPSVTFLGIM